MALAAPPGAARTVRWPRVAARRRCDERDRSLVVQGGRLVCSDDFAAVGRGDAERELDAALFDRQGDEGVAIEREAKGLVPAGRELALDSFARRDGDGGALIATRLRAAGRGGCRRLPTEPTIDGQFARAGSLPGRQERRGQKRGKEPRYRIDAALAHLFLATEERHSVAHSIFQVVRLWDRILMRGDA
jgi:hypothetical protein